MKSNNFLLTFRNALMATFFLVGVAQTGAIAQDQDTAITDEELTTYAIVMDSIEVMKLEINDTINAMIQNEELMQRGRRFVEIRGAAGDSVKMKEINVTAEELAAYDVIQDVKSQMAADLNTNVNELVKVELGPAAYNKINKALRSDPEVKKRYEVILTEVQAKGNIGEETDNE